MIRSKVAVAAVAAVALAALALEPLWALSGTERRPARGLELAAPAALAPRFAPGLHERVEGASLEAMARNYLARHGAAWSLVASDEHALGLKAVREGRAVDVVRFRQMAGGVPVYRGEIAVSFNRRGETLYVANDLRPLVGAVETSPAVTKVAARKTALEELGIRGALTLDRSELVVFPATDRARLAWWIQLVPYGEPHGDWHVLVDAITGEPLRVENMALDFDGTGRSYLPDPLSSAGVTYNTAGYVDGSDATTPELLAQILSVTLPEITFNGAAYTLTGPYADCREIESPTVACPTDVDGDFSDQATDRTDDDFEPQLVYHHIDAFMRYINVTLGIAVTPYQYAGGVRFDAHGLSNADNSHYVPGTGILAFGDGGVDDSEDPDVVIHELGHGLHDWLTSGGLSQTQGLSEGLGDYFGISYSRTFSGQWAPSDPQYNWMFSWDGHNPFWSGRLTNWNDNHLYPTGLVNQIHTDGQFWASCNIDIGEAIGYDLADAAVIEGISMTGGSTNQAAAAQAVIDAAIALGYSAPTVLQMVGIYNSNSGSAGCNYGVVADLGLFVDGFESGDATLWSAIAP